MVNRFLFIVFFSVFISGCGGALKRGWTNFTTYYNTYYNAAQYFGEGQKAVQDQEITLEPESPVRIHHSPIAAGTESFEKAIEKSTLVLQQHSESKWVDDALLLMGKSQYYLGNFLAAIKRFEQLDELDADSSLMQQATIWKGRALLDLNDYERGITYLEPILQSYPKGWSNTAKGELQALVGEYYAMLEDWENASAFLSKALLNISDRTLLGHSYFLYGQMLEREERLGEAQYAYKQVLSYFPGTEYTYWSNVKQADVARKQGNLEVALSIYRRLEKNDKYYGRRNQLIFKIARILQMQGKAKEAEQYYRELLYGEKGNNERTLQANIYHQLGKMYSDTYQNYPTAAAYFDTSSSLRSQDGIRFDLADAYSHYVDLQVSIERADSLLWLGSLAPEKLDSVIKKMRSNEQQRLLEEQQKKDNNSLRNRPTLEQKEEDSTRSAIYGFLNHRNQNLLNQGKREFQILWGDRPLVDNWRRREALNQSLNRSNSDPSPESPEKESDSNKTVALELGLEAIPATEADRLQLRKDRLHAQYQLGNVLHLELSRLDSAKIFYYKVIHTQLDDEVRPKAMYALYELFQTESQTDSVRYWKNRIIAEFPVSEYARLVTSNGDQPVQMETDSTRLIDEYHAVIASKGLSKGATLRSLALENKTSDLAAHIHFQAIEAYVDKAQMYQRLTEMLFSGLLNAKSDSAGMVEPNPDILKIIFSSDQRYRTAHWDSVRTILAEHDSLFSGSAFQSSVAALQKELEVSSATLQEMPTCNEEGVSLQVRPDMESFLQSVKWPGHLEEKSFSGEIMYTFEVSPEGKIQSYKLVSPQNTPGIEKVLEEAFEESLNFDPLEVDRDLTKLRCEMVFPIDR